MDPRKEQEARITERLNDPTNPTAIFAAAVETLVHKGLTRDQMVVLLDLLLKALPAEPQEAPESKKPTWRVNIPGHCKVGSISVG